MTQVLPRLDADQQREVAVRDMLVDHALAAVGRAQLDPALHEAPAAVRDRAVLAAAIAHLIAAGAIPADLDPHRLAYAPRQLPEHLRPDTDELLRGSRRVPDLLAQLTKTAA